jgi:UDP-N-acetylmuramoyl-L-alanyl-D-glutamate--2,6-diaminopimelate ligase
MMLQINKTDVWTHFIGDFNASNLIAVYSVAHLLGIDSNEILLKISELTPVRGRLETVKNSKEITAIVDYAHTPDALKNVLHTIHKIKNFDQQIITVVGAGGNRDKEKRPLMAQTALDYSDKLILTSDNPRFEEPADILLDMEAGIGHDKYKVLIIENREQAIKTACMMANKGDIILVAGKGHETYQEIKGVKHHFDDIEVLTECLK